MGSEKLAGRVKQNARESPGVMVVIGRGYSEYPSQGHSESRMQRSKALRDASKIIEKIRPEKRDQELKRK